MSLICAARWLRKANWSATQFCVFLLYQDLRPNYIITGWFIDTINYTITILCRTATKLYFLKVEEEAVNYIPHRLSLYSGDRESSVVPFSRVFPSKPVIRYTRWGKKEGGRGWYGAFHECGPLVEYLAAKVKRGPTKLLQVKYQNYETLFYLTMHRKLLFSKQKQS